LGKKQLSNPKLNFLKISGTKTKLDISKMMFHHVPTGVESNELLEKEIKEETQKDPKQCLHICNYCVKATQEFCVKFTVICVDFTEN
jgi:hypothetical protein